MTTKTISADLEAAITPCQCGGDPDCQQCGCIASMALAAVGHYRVVGQIAAGDLFAISDSVGQRWKTTAWFLGSEAADPHASESVQNSQIIDSPTQHMGGQERSRK